METFAMYLLKSAIWLTGFALVYFLFLQNERFFRLKRFYLIAGILISFIFPFFTFHYQVEMPAPPENITDISASDTGVAPFVQPVLDDKLFDYRYVLLLAYFSGMLFFVFKAVSHISLLLKTIKKTKVKNLNRARVIRASQFSGSFSFFNYVFINPSVDDREVDVIMKHELVHITQKHWLDLILVELLRMFQWANPFAWIYTGFIRQNHEYIADAVALQHTPNPAVYKAVLVNQLFDSRIISLANSFNYSLNKKRFDMMKKIVTSPYRKMKVLLVLPVFAIVFYAFARPEYHYVMPSELQMNPAPTTEAIQKEARGVVVDEDGMPLQGVTVIVTKSTISVTTDARGRFAVSRIPDGSALIFSCKGYKTYTLPPLIASNSALRVRLVKDPEYKEKAETSSNTPGIQRQWQSPLVVIDGAITEKNYMDATGELGYDLAIIKNLFGKEATDKYGEKGANGVMEITTRKKALELGIKPEYFPRLAPEDYPTFQNQKWTSFREWVINQVKYPAETTARKLEGWVTVNFTVELDGTISNLKPLGSSDPILSDEVIKVIKTSPKWDLPKNPAVDMPFISSVNVGFELPDQIVTEEPFVVVEEMPMYPGGEGELLKFIEVNTQYPEAAKAQKIGGKVIVRFYVNPEGETEGLSVLKGVHPLLDAEALRVIDMLSGFKPGRQGGKAVPVWYMVPVNFILPETNQP